MHVRTSFITYFYYINCIYVYSSTYVLYNVQQCTCGSGSGRQQIFCISEPVDKMYAAYAYALAYKYTYKPAVLSTGRIILVCIAYISNICSFNSFYLSLDFVFFSYFFVALFINFFSTDMDYTLVDIYYFHSHLLLLLLLLLSTYRIYLGVSVVLTKRYSRYTRIYVWCVCIHSKQAKENWSLINSVDLSRLLYESTYIDIFSKSDFRTEIDGERLRARCLYAVCLLSV